MSRPGKKKQKGIGFNGIIAEYQNDNAEYESKNQKIVQATSQAQSIVIQNKHKLQKPQSPKKQLSSNIHDDCNHKLQQRQRELKAQRQEHEQDVKRLKQDIERLQAQLVYTKAKLQQKQQVTCRTELQYKDLLAKYCNKKKEAQDQTTCIRELSKKLKNVVTYTKTKSVYQENVKTHQIETLERIIKWNDEVAQAAGDWDEKEMQLRDITKLAEHQKGDIQLLMQKIVEKEDYYQSFVTIDKEEYRKWEEQRSTMLQTCECIQSTLRSWKEIQDNLEEKCEKITLENKFLRQQICISQQSQKQLIEKISHYDKEIKNLIQIFGTYKSNVDKRQEQLAKQMQIKFDKMFSQKYRLQDLDAKFNSQQFQKLNSKISERQNIQPFQKGSFRYTQSQVIDQQPGQRRDGPQRRQSLSKSCKIKPWVLNSSEILQQNDSIRQQILQKFQKQSLQIAKSHIFFKKDEYSHNFGNYLRKLPILFLIIKINKQKYIGGFTDEFLENGDQMTGNFTAFLFTCSDGKNVQFYDKNDEKNRPQKLNSARYDQNSLIFGNSELILQNNSKDKKVVLNIHIFGKTYYDGNIKKQAKGKGLLVNGGNIIEYEELEMHAMEYMTSNRYSIIQT